MDVLDIVRRRISSVIGLSAQKDFQSVPGSCRPEPSIPSVNNRSKIVICVPNQLRQAAKIVDLLQSGCSVLLNLENVDDTISNRLLDFIAGVAYHNENQIRQVAPSAYLILPFDADILIDRTYSGYSETPFVVSGSFFTE